jgi:hypothetical protein
MDLEHWFEQDDRNVLASEALEPNPFRVDFLQKKEYFFQCGRSGMFMPDPRSGFVSMLDPGSRISDPRSNNKKEEGEKNWWSYYFLWP